MNSCKVTRLKIKSSVDNLWKPPVGKRKCKARINQIYSRHYDEENHKQYQKEPHNSLRHCHISDKPAQEGISTDHFMLN